MAAHGTVFKVHLHISDFDHNHYADYRLTLAQHSSETNERLMVRLFAFVLFACDDLHLGKELCHEHEPDLWIKDLTGAYQLWIMVGLPSEKEIRKACGHSERVVILAYGQVQPWWASLQHKMSHYPKVSVITLAQEDTLALSALTERSMALNCSLLDGTWQISPEGSDVGVAITTSIRL